jgi:hypothetical protein
MGGKKIPEAELMRAGGYGKIENRQKRGMGKKNYILKAYPPKPTLCYNSR